VSAHPACATRYRPRRLICCCVVVVVVKSRYPGDDGVCGGARHAILGHYQGLLRAGVENRTRLLGLGRAVRRTIADQSQPSEQVRRSATRRRTLMNGGVRGISRDVTFPLNSLSGPLHRDVAALSRVTGAAKSSPDLATSPSAPARSLNLTTAQGSPSCSKLLGASRRSRHRNGRFN
jgi:hypothetical protein